VDAGATLAVEAGGAGFLASDLNSLLTGSAVSFDGGSSLAIDTSNAGGSFVYPDPLNSLTFGLTKIGTGTLTLACANSYASTDLEAGTLQVTAGGALGSGSLTVNGGSLDLDGQNVAVASLSGGGTITNSSGSASTLTVGQGTAAPFWGDIEDGSGTVALAVASYGSLALDGTASLSTAIAIGAGGTLTVGDGAELGADIDDGGGAVVFDVAGSETYSGAIDGTGSVTVSGGGTVYLTGDSTFSGSTTVAPGSTLDVASTTALPGYPSGTLSVQAGGTLAFGVGGADPWTATQIAGFLTGGDFASGANVGIDTGDGATFVYDSATSGDASAADVGFVVLGSGTVQLGAGATFAADQGLAVLDGTLDLNGQSITVASLSGGGTITNGSSAVSTVTVDQGAGTIPAPFSGSIQDVNNSIAIDVYAGGNLTLDGPDTITQGVEVDAGGTLTLGDGAALNAAITDDGGAIVFDVAGSLTYSGCIGGSGSVSVCGGGIVYLTGDNSGFGGTTTVA
jgi:autotransporter-associated beta strand protein